MKKSLFIVFFLISCNIHAQEWTKVEENKVSINYINSGSIRNIGDALEFYRLVNFFDSNSVGRKSVVLKMRVSCSNRKIMYLSYKTFSDDFGSGNMIKSKIIQQLTWIAPKSNDYKLSIIHFVCNNNKNNY